MWKNPYSQFAKKELTLNDYLAIDRTVLANERTLLSYVRTSLTLLVIGGTCFKFFDVLWLNILGLVFMGIAVVVVLHGWTRYRRMHLLLGAALRHETGTPSHPLEGEVRSESKEKSEEKEAIQERPTE
ncbi:MAG TPA: DUF202 domain-containing protein [Candidatus Hydrogenedentes bacterium]|nr:DUF202 domain-containing protein [Candidatus Hydrogenedentota bacterium]